MAYEFRNCVSIAIHILRLSTGTGGECLLYASIWTVCTMILLLHIFQTDENEAFERARVQRTTVRIRARTQTQSSSSEVSLCVQKIVCIFDYIVHAYSDRATDTDIGTHGRQQQIHAVHCVIIQCIYAMVVAAMIITLCLFEILLFRVRLKSMRARCRSLFVSCIQFDCCVSAWNDNKLHILT